MPFIDGRYYMNPAYGRALQRARAAEAARDAEAKANRQRSRSLQLLPSFEDAGVPSGQPIPRARDADTPGVELLDSESGSPQQQEGGHWVTIDGRHVLIHEPQVKSKPLPSSGQASIYADSFEGRKTANGATFHQNGYTAALLPRSRWQALPLGTRVELTHEGNSVVVEVNDRGAGDRNPQSTRALDLSRQAASALTGQPINNDQDAKTVGLIRLDKIRVVPGNTPLGPVRH